jgi:hypothetical protein
MSYQTSLVKNLANAYFLAFSNKDLFKIQSMFSQNIILRDWDITAQGFDQVSAANQKIFDSVSTIVVNPINIFVDEHTVIGELEITINNLEVIKVVDLIEFNQDLKIVAIKAFKG